jgi:hypothetical protein
MRRLLAAVGVLVVGLCGKTVATDPPTPEQIVGLVQQLASNRYADRESAGRKLVKAGTVAIPALQAVLATTTDTELRTRAENVLDVLVRQANAARLTAPKKITLDYNQVPLAAAVDDFKAKTGINLILLPGRVADPTRAVTVKIVDELSVWQAFDEFCQAAGLREEFRTSLELPNQTTSYSMSGRIRSVYDANSVQPLLPANAPVYLIDGQTNRLPGDRATAVRVLAMPGRFPGNGIIRGTGRIILTLDVTPLPEVNWQEVTSVRVTRAVDEDGRPIFADMKPEIEMPSHTSYWGAPVWLGGGAIWFDDGGYPVSGSRKVPNPRLVSVALRSDDRVIRELIQFEGVVVGEINLTDVPLITIDSLEAAVGKTPFIGPNEMKLTVVGYDIYPDGQVRVKLRIESWQPWVLQQIRRGGVNQFGGIVFWGGGMSDNLDNVATQLKWLDASGVAIAIPQQLSTSYSSDGWRQIAELTFQFPKSDKHRSPAKLVLSGTKPVTVEVPFRMTNVKLP